MSEGWIKLHRRLLESQMYRNLNSKQRDVMIQCLLLANHSESEWTWGEERYSCKPGEFVTSLESIKQKCGMGTRVQSVRTALLKLEKWGFLTNKSTKSGRLISIVKWDLYQKNDNENNKEDEMLLTKRQQSVNKEPTTNKNDKNVKNGEEEENITAQAREVLEYLNEIKGARFRKIEDIIPRLREGYTVEDCKKVIFQKSKDQYFIDHPKYLCPETLFRPSHFEKYLNENGTKINETMAPQQKQTINPGLTDVNAINDKILYEKMPGNLMPGDRERIAREHPDWVMGEI